MLHHASPVGEQRPTKILVKKITLSIDAGWLQRSERVGWLLVAPLALALRLPLLNRFPLREDEAIYGWWALTALLDDPHFLAVWPDKPPLFLWLQGIALQLFGATAPGARLLNISLSTLTVLLIGAAARRWWGVRAGLAAAAAAALSPFAVSFAPTGFTDPLLTVAGAALLAAAARQQWGWAGAALGIAVITKQQGLLFAPLLALLLLLPVPGPAGAGRWLRAGRGALVVLLPVLLWDASRWAVAPSPWDLGAQNVGALTLAPAGLWLDRLAGWSVQLWYFVASPWVAAALVLLFFSALRSPSLHASALFFLLTFWAGGFLLVHLLTTVPVWDRYLLPLQLPVALTIGWAAGRTSDQLAPLVLVALLLMLPPAIAAARGQLPIGSDHGDYAGLEEAIAMAAGAEPGAPAVAGSTVIYHQSLGWHLRFYLYAPAHRGEVAERWVANSAMLADDATKQPGKTLTLIEPVWAPLRDLPLQLASRGLEPTRIGRTGNFSVYAITPAASLPGRVISCRASRWPRLAAGEAVATPRSQPGTLP